MAFVYFSPFQIYTISTVCTWDPFSISKARSQASSLLEVLNFFFFNDAAEVGASYAHFLKSFYFFNQKWVLSFMKGFFETYKQLIEFKIKTNKPIKKWPEDLRRQFSKEYVPMANRHTQRYSALVIVFSRQEYWSGMPFLSPGDLPDLGIELRD